MTKINIELNKKDLKDIGNAILLYINFKYDYIDYLRKQKQIDSKEEKETRNEIKRYAKILDKIFKED